VAPEVFLGVGGYDDAADVFSFGILLQTMCAGSPDPYAERYITSDQAVKGVAELSLRPSIPSALADTSLALLMECCWTASPVKRPKMTDVAVKLYEILAKCKREEKNSSTMTWGEWLAGK
jgi:hypothetical protein